MTAAAGRVRARIEPRLTARVAKRTPLLYARGADAALDRPAHVRAGSALARLPTGALAVVQDDASFVAIVLPEDGAVRDLPLPATNGQRQFDDTRGNKKEKLDLEACFVAEGGDLLVSLGSGSSPKRERVVLVTHPARADAGVTVTEATALYTMLRAHGAFAGSELNIEGAAVCGPDVLLFQRGNGAATDTTSAVDATARVELAHLVAYLHDLARSETTLDVASLGAPPPLREVVSWDLGDVSGTRLTFTDGAALPSPAAGSFTAAFLACAEDCPDATRDGPVTGVALGRLDDRGRVAELAFVLDENGTPLVDKAEGLAFDPTDRTRAFIVIDKDDPAVASELLELVLGEGWHS